METEQTLLSPAPARKKINGVKVGADVLKYAFLVLLIVVLLFPLFVMICLSILPDSEINRGVIFSPSGTINFGTYITIFTSSLSGGYMRYLVNSLIIGLITAVGIPLSSALCAYGFCKMEFKGRDVYFAIVLATMMIPSVISIIPLYTIYVRLGWLNSPFLFPMWVPGLFGGGATNIFLMRQYMRSIPNDLIKAAKLDGASSVYIFFRIMLPLCIPIMLYVAVTAFMGAWNDFMTPYTYVSRGQTQAYTLALGIYYDYGPGSTKAPFSNYAMAAGVVMIIPCAILFFAFQKYLVEGVAGSGMKD